MISVSSWEVYLSIRKITSKLKSRNTIKQSGEGGEKRKPTFMPRNPQDFRKVSFKPVPS
jgi:hypothetical protein